MNKLILVIGSLTLATNITFADPSGTTADPGTQPPDSTTSATPTPPPSPTPSSSVSSGQHPCNAIKQACKAAGFVKGGHSTGKGLYHDCLKPILAGQDVSGVSVNPADVQACQQKHQAKTQ